VSDAITAIDRDRGRARASALPLRACACEERGKERGREKERAKAEQKKLFCFFSSVDPLSSFFFFFSPPFFPLSDECAGAIGTKKTVYTRSFCGGKRKECGKKM
jgi:hypothetical protein